MTKSSRRFALPKISSFVKHSPSKIAPLMPIICQRGVSRAAAYFSRVGARLILLAISITARSAIPPTPTVVDRHDVGVAHVGQTLHHEFGVTNSSNRSVRIEGVRSLCDCLQVASQLDRVGPGAVAKLAVVVVPQRPGAFDSGVQVEIAGESSSRVFMVSGWAVEDVRAGVENWQVSAEELISHPAESRDVIFVDVRMPEQFRLGHIPGSLNMPLHTVKARSFLRSNRVILLNEGHDDRTLLGECLNLQGLSFTNVQVLLGGLGQWRRSGGTLEGEHPTSAALGEISPRQFQQVSPDPGWLIVNLTDNENEALATEASANLALSISADPSRTQTDLQHLLSIRGGARSPRRLLLVTSSGADYSEVEHILSGFHDAPVFYLSGGMDAFRDYERRQAATQNRHLVTQSNSENSPTRFNSSSTPGMFSGCCGGKR